ncbi:MAG: class 3 adenylate cyclase/tetratricopeptide (TPR) repeat protein [Gammaproteobacteria bacterium]|jgi:class 3 adenylate cyclase/tetratricopeptide (TPR) repeat protein
MICEHCQRDNPPRAKFCLECGTAFAQRCSKCQTELPANSKFCLECGQSTNATVSETRTGRTRDPRDYTPKHLADKILKSRAAIEGERKQVSVLFVDIKHSMELAGAMDAEDWHRILDRFFAVLNEAVHRFEGTVNQYTGDGIMALFGAPIAHEDHAQRACYAALQMREELRRFSIDLRIEQRLDFGVRIGINSGDVVVASIGDDLRMDYTAQGQTVGIAQRLEQLAETGHVYISENTARLIQGFFQVTDLGASRLVNGESAISVYDLDDTTQSRTRLQVARARGLTQFVGRDNEMHILESALERAKSGRGQVVGVVGEPGLGKSRLCFEFAERCRARGISVYEAHCPSHGKSIPFIPILELFRNYFDISEQDSSAQARQKIAGALVLLDASLHESLPVLFELLGVADADSPAPTIDADARKRRLFDMLHKVIRAQSDRGVGAVTLIDDLHWVDDWSNEYIGQMVEALEQSRGLLLVNFRPEYVAAWSGRSHYQQLPLVPLDPAAIKELVEALLGNDESVTDLAQKIMDWTGGNPLYSEEIINTLIETEQLTGQRGAYHLTRAVDLLEVPANVQAIIAGRIDRTDENAKHVLQAASVVGKNFSRVIIERITEIRGEELTIALDCLKAADFLFETALYPVVEFSFKHPLVHEVAYETQLREQRKVRHGRVAEALEEIEAKRIDEFASMLAYHWERADLPNQALYWNHRAAVIAQSNDPSSAFAHWSKVRSLINEIEPTIEDLNLGAEACGNISNLGWRLGSEEDQAHKHFEDGIALADRAGNIFLKAMLTGTFAAMRGVAHGYMNDYISYGKEATQLADLTDNRELRCAMRNWVIYGNLFSGRLRESLDLSQQVLDTYRADVDNASQFLGLDCRWSLESAVTVAVGLMGNFKNFRGAFALVRQACGDDPELNAFSSAMESLIHVYYGRFDEALSMAQSAVNDGETKGTGYCRSMARQALGFALLHHGEFETAAEVASESLEIMLIQNTGRSHFSGASGTLALAELALGNPEQARSRSADTIAFCHERELYWDLTPWQAMVQASIVLGDHNSAIAVLGEMEAKVNSAGLAVQTPKVHELRAMFAETFDSEWDYRTEMALARDAYSLLDARDHIVRIGQATNSVM